VQVLLNLPVDSPAHEVGFENFLVGQVWQFLAFSISARLQNVLGSVVFCQKAFKVSLAILKGNEDVFGVETAMHQRMHIKTVKHLQSSTRKIL
jgi:hypothetical protein